jgi:hypothetical protein
MTAQNAGDMSCPQHRLPDAMCPACMTNKPASQNGEDMPVVMVSLETARLVRGAFLPSNPNKLRNGDDNLKAAAWEFIRAVEAAEAANRRPR